MIDHAYERMFERINDLSSSSNEKNYPALYSYCWSIIDSTRRLIRLYKTLPSESNHSQIKIIEYINSPRNTFQHLDERIEESLIDSRQPFYGILKWVFNNPISGKTENHIAISGILYTEKHDFKIGTYNDKQIIEDLILVTVDRKEKIEINLSKLMTDITLVIDNLEGHLIEQFKINNHQSMCWKSRRDVFLKYKGV